MCISLLSIKIYAKCTMFDTSDAAWQQAQLSLSRGGFGLRRLSLHSPAAYMYIHVDSAIAYNCSSPQSKHLLHAIDLFNASVYLLSMSSPLPPSVLLN